MRDWRVMLKHRRWSAWRFWRWPLVGAPVILSGCVFGYGACLLQQPVKVTLTGHVHFREYPTPQGLDHVPILALDKTAYVYAPAESQHCLSANDVQLEGLAEFPRDVIENTHVSVEGTLYSATSSNDHTPFLMNVQTILPMAATAH